MPEPMHFDLEFNMQNFWRTWLLWAKVTLSIGFITLALVFVHKLEKLGNGGLDESVWKL